MKRHQVEVAVIPEDEEGDIDIEALEGLIKQGSRKPVLIAITHVPTSSGRHAASRPSVHLHLRTCDLLPQRQCRQLTCFRPKNCN